MIKRRNLLYIGNKLAVHGKLPSGIDDLSVRIEGEGFRVFTASSKENKTFRLADMVLSTLRHRDEVACVLIDTYSTQNFYYAVIIAKLCRILKVPYIPILHGGNLPQRLESSKNLSRELFGNAMTNVVPSTYLLEKFKAKGYTNLTYIPNTIEIDNYPFLLRKKLRPRLLWVRSFAELYNPMLAIKLVEQLKKEGVEVELCMVGPDKDGLLERCKNKAEALNLPITFTGKLEKAEWIALAADYDIFINTTNFDNMPVSVMEAMALGLPIISTNVGGLAYLIENTKDGILVPPNNPALFSKAITNLLENQEMATQLLLNARKKVEAFDWQEVKHSWFRLLES